MTSSVPEFLRVPLPLSVVEQYLDKDGVQRLRYTPKCRDVGGCDRSTAPNRGLCNYHMRELRRLRQELGYCGVCGKPADPGTYSCSEHKEKRSKINTRRYREGLHKICYRCRQPLPPEDTEYARCASCRARALANRRRRKAMRALSASHAAPLK